MKLLMCFLMCCSCLYLAASWIPIVPIQVREIKWNSQSLYSNSAQDLNVHYTEGCSHKGMYLQCVCNKATHNDNRFRKDIWKTALMGTLPLMVPSRDVNSFVLRSMGA